MLNEARLKKALDQYKQVFVSQHWADEKYKWEAVKWFQKNWDVNAPDFAYMLSRALDRTYNLLTSVNNFPKGMIVEFAKTAPEEVRAMFIDLFDEGKDVFERINAFKLQSSILLEKQGDGAAQHYQYENPISTYLWLRYPDKYYIYKFGEVKNVTSALESDYTFKKGAYAENVRNFLRLYDEINKVVKQDTELVRLFQSQLTETCYSDPELKTLTIDLCFYMSRTYSQNKQDSETKEEYVLDEGDPNLVSDEWLPPLEKYTPGFTREKWLELLNNKKIIGSASGALAAFYEFGGQATCKQIAQRYNKDASGISSTCTQLAIRVYKKTECPLSIRENGLKQYWPILFQGKKADSDAEGGYIWKLRPELYEALKEFDIMRYQWKTTDEPSKSNGGVQYWWLSANPKIWSYSNIGAGEVQAYTLFNENGNKRRIFQNFLDAKPGDLVIGYESTPVKQIVALAKISTAQDGEKLYFEKVEGLTSPIDYSVLRDCPELAEMEYFQNPQGSLYRLSKAEYDFIMDLIREENPLESEDKGITYSKNDFLDEVYMSEEAYESLAAVLRNKKNIILQGAPGVGKTFAARRLAWSMIGEMDDSRIELVQFHQNYSYEDFVMGYKPAEEGFELKYGIFYRFCQKAANQPDKEFFFIIDEINRGNMSKIFGELLMLIERDYRGTKATLAYNGLAFSVPKNLYIIGMMNTADRSLAMIDYALRRRFSFYEMEPGFDSDGFIQYQKGLNNETFDELVDRVKELNKEISMDKSLGKGFCIGHSYFCGHDVCTDEWLRSIVNYDILPMLSEYWFDDATKLQRWENILRGVFQ